MSGGGLQRSCGEAIRRGSVIGGDCAGDEWRAATEGGKWDRGRPCPRPSSSSVIHRAPPTWSHHRSARPWRMTDRLTSPRRTTHLGRCHAEPATIMRVCEVHTIGLRSNTHAVEGCCVQASAKGRVLTASSGDADQTSTPARDARCTRSTMDVAFILRIMRERCTLMVFSTMPSSAAICLLSNPATTFSNTWRSRGVRVSSFSEAECRERAAPRGSLLAMPSKASDTPVDRRARVQV